MFNDVLAEASRLAKAGFYLAAKILRDAVATNDAERVNDAAMRVALLLEHSGKFTLGKGLRTLAENTLRAKAERLWGAAR